ncbi:hypothetical protein IWX90DRAFT_265323 [Phyllosticta citrichinensis]|uniref:Uncharacterized protein n=1 Tax=Phyllosticta citrichinensis TaxID=1130410 RepID=A0ABR1XM56_9PEZI
MAALSVTAAATRHKTNISPGHLLVLMDKKNIVYVMSGRTPKELERLLSRVPGLVIIAENGCFVRECGPDDGPPLPRWTRSTSGISVRECGPDEYEDKRISWSSQVLLTPSHPTVTPFPPSTWKTEHATCPCFFYSSTAAQISLNEDSSPSIRFHDVPL